MTEQQDQKGKDKRREKKEQKKKRKRDGEEAASIEKETDVSRNKDDDTAKTKSKELLKKRRLEREKLLELVPKVDENGISYTKQQIRLMRNRVQKGLHPIETPAEKHHRMVEEARIRREVEAELAGFDQNDQDDNGNGNYDDHDNNKDENHDNIQSDSRLLKTPKSHTDDNVADHTDQPDYSYEKRPSTEDPTERPPMKKKRRAKPVPPDYVCSACRGTNKDQPPHWIYDCAYKKTMPGTNQVSRKKRGLHDPLETKLFVSGLPFDSTVHTVTELFTSHHQREQHAQGTAATTTTTNNNKEPAVVVVHCKLIQFADTKRCKGQAFVTFATPAAAHHAMTLNGTMVIPSSSSSKTATKTNVGTTKELKLKITKVLNRALTKK